MHSIHNLTKDIKSIVLNLWNNQEPFQLFNFLQLQ